MIGSTVFPLALRFLAVWVTVALLGSVEAAAGASPQDKCPSLQSQSSAIRGMIAQELEWILSHQGKVGYAGDIPGAPPPPEMSLHDLAVHLISTLRQRQRESPEDRKSTRLNSSHSGESRMPSSA